MTSPRKEYLGDGLYAEFDGVYIELSAPREEGEHWVGLEMETLFALIRFANEVGWGKLIERALKNSTPNKRTADHEQPRDS